MSGFPQVLLLGNGLSRAYGGISWSELLQDISVRKDIKSTDLTAPEPLQAIIMTENHIDVAMKNKKTVLFGMINNLKQRDSLCELLNMGFDEILTTNYSYELEMAGLNLTEVEEKNIVKLQRHTDEIKKAEKQYLLHTYNEVAKNHIWHIHGEARKPDSMILGHFYYGNLLYKIKNVVEKRGNIYETLQRQGKQAEVRSWIDAFLLGDLYILGFNFGLSEFDLWWLLNRRSREKASTGKVYFYSPKLDHFDEKEDLLSLLGVEIISLGFYKSVGLDGKEHLQGKYEDFYSAALNDIKEKIGSITKLVGFRVPDIVPSAHVK